MTQPARLDLNSLLLFHAVADTGSLTRGAAQLKMPKATVSRRLRQLERQLATLLIRRGPASLTLTAAGTAFYTHSQRLVAEARGLGEYARTLHGDPGGALKLLVPTGLMGSICGRAVLRLAAQFPDLQLEVQHIDRALAAAQEDFDVSVQVGSRPTAGMPICLLARIRRAAYASAEYLQRRGTPARTADLSRHDAVILTSQLDSGLWPAMSRKRRPVPHALVSDILLARDLALAGVGIAVLPQALCRQALAQGRLVPILPRWRIPAAQVIARYPDTRYLPASVSALLGLLRAEFAAFAAEEAAVARVP